jgi:cytoskeletal protein CcmA (bactofilin family)
LLQLGNRYMAWFDRNPGGKKVPEKVPEKTPEAVKPAPQPAPVPAAPLPAAPVSTAPVAAAPVPAAPVPAAPVAAAPVAAAPEPKPEAPKVEAPPPPAPAALVGHLYKGSRVSGQLSFQGPARIDGAVDGEIHCEGILTIGEGAEVRAKISGQTVVIRGKVEGNVTAKEKVELAAPARLIGNIDTPRLIMTEGVVFDGDCAMGVAKQKGGVASSQSVNDKSAAPAPKLQADSKN